MPDPSVAVPARVLAAALEPVAGQVYFSPECHGLYAGLGFSPSPLMAAGVAMPDGPAYFCSRGSVLGQVPGEVIAAAFGVFNPAAVVPAVAYGWSITAAATICAARTEGAVGQLWRILGPEPDGLTEATALLQVATGGLRPEGKPLYSGLLALDMPDDPMGAAWRLTDLLREFRGDAHTAAWTAAGFDAVEIGLATEQYWGVPPRSYVRTRAWSTADLDAAEARLEARGLMAAGLLTDAGRALREEVEHVTDAQCGPIVTALGDDLERLVTLLSPWGSSIRAAGGYLPSGPHDLAIAAGGAASR